MQLTKKILSLLLVAAMMVSIAGCGAPQADSPAAPAAGVQYTVTVKTAGGMATADADVYVYEDSTLSELAQYGKTGADGRAAGKLHPGREK